MFASIRQWGNRLMTTWETKAEENKVRERSASFAEKYASLPEKFSLNDILPLYRNKKSAQSAISVLVKKDLVQKVENITRISSMVSPTWLAMPVWRWRWATCSQ